MLSSVRRTARTWVAAVILFLVLTAIVITGFGTGGFGGLGNLGGGGTPAGDELARVNGEPVTAAEVSDLATRAYQQARQQQPTLDMAAFVAQGGFDQILYQAIITRAIRQYGEARGLIVSRQMVDREIANIPAFRNFTGQFDPTAFRAALASANLTEAALRADITRTLIQRQLLGPVALGARVPENVAREYASLLLERRRGTIAVVPAAMMAQGINPTDAELARYYQRNRAAFTIPERRVIKYAVIGPEQVARAAAATEAEIARVYRNSSAAYGPRETRTLQQIVLPTQAAAQAFAQRVRGGTPFLDAARQAGFSAGDVSFADQRRDQFATATTPQVAQAAFAAAQGAVAGPIRSELGFHVVRVDRVTSVPARPLEAVRGDIARAIEQRKRTDALATLIARIEEQLADGASFEETARGAGLAIVTTPPITAAGQAVSGPAWQVPAELRPLLTSAFEIDAEQLEPLVEQLATDGRFVLLGVERVEPAAPPPFAQIRDEVRTRFVQRAALQRARALADAVVGRINGGMAPARALAESQPRVTMSQPINMRRLEISRGGQQVPAPLLALFSIPEGRARVMATPENNGWFIVVHEQRTPGNSASDAALITSTRAEFARSAGEEIAQQFARAIELRSEIARNPEAIARARRQAGGGAVGTE
jgi:peptidyl-prolyl cis-trans isomerase D